MQRRDVLKALAAMSSGITGTTLGETNEELVEIKDSDLLAVLYTQYPVSAEQRKQLEGAWSKFWKRAGKSTPPVPILVLCKDQMKLVLVKKGEMNRNGDIYNG